MAVVLILICFINKLLNPHLNLHTPIQRRIVDTPGSLKPTITNYNSQKSVIEQCHNQL